MASMEQARRNGNVHHRTSHMMMMMMMWPSVHQWFWVFLTTGTVYHSSKTVKRQSKQHKMTIGVPIVTCLPKLYQQCTISTIVKNSQKTAKTAKTALGVPIVTGLPRLYQQCNNRPSVPIVKNSQTAKNYHWCTNRHMSTQHPLNTQSRLRVPTVLPSSEWK